MDKALAVLKQIIADYKSFAKSGDEELFNERLMANIIDAEQIICEQD